MIGITSPIIKLPSDALDDTEATVGTTVSTTKSLFAPSELVAPGSAKVRAAEMLGGRYPLVSEALQKERDAMDEANKCNEQRSLAALRRIRDMAAADKSYAASVAAEYRRGSIVGLYVERKEIRTGTIDSMEREEVEKAIQKLKEDHSIETSFEEIKELENKS